jgi:hypothetical protein
MTDENADEVEIRERELAALERELATPRDTDHERQIQAEIDRVRGLGGAKRTRLRGEKA